MTESKVTLAELEAFASQHGVNHTDSLRVNNAVNETLRSRRNRVVNTTDNQMMRAAKLRERLRKKLEKKKSDDSKNKVGKS